MTTGPEDLSPARVAELLRDGAQGVDVREQYERDAGHIADTLHIELDQLAASADTLDRGRPLIFYCRTGSRSALAAQAFAAAGFEAHNLDGGLQAWVKYGLPIQPADGHVA
jgi:rhodanese-related sulfurtransferase